MTSLLPIFRRHGNPFGRLPEEIYKHIRGKAIGFNCYDRENAFFRGSALKEIRKVMNFRENYEFEMYVNRFERDFAGYMGGSYSVGSDSGTSALTLALKALGIGEGDEVITVPNTYIATALSITNTGATPVFAEIDENSWNMDPDLVEDKISDKTKAIIPVHLYGNPCHMNAIIRMARKHGLKVIEDACQSHGAEYKERKTGSMGDIGCFSFFTNKNLSGLGNGGIAVTGKRYLAKRIREMSSADTGSNILNKSGRTPSELDAIQVAFLRPRLTGLDAMNQRRRENAGLYKELLKDSGLGFQEETRGGKHVYFSFVVRSRNRERLRKHLARRGVETRVEYPVPLHLASTFSYLGYRKGDFPVAERLCREVLSLPVHPFIGNDQILDITKKVRSLRG